MRRSVSDEVALAAGDRGTVSLQPRETKLGANTRLVSREEDVAAGAEAAAT